MLVRREKDALSKIHKTTTYKIFRNKKFGLFQNFAYFCTVSNYENRREKQYFKTEAKKYLYLKSRAAADAAVSD